MKIVGEEELTVKYIQHTGNDMGVVHAAQRSTKKMSDSMDKAEIGLIKFLAKNKHMTPFEHNSITFEIECPLFIRSQIHRHRTFSYNELSGRYSVVGDRYYIPKVYHSQDDKNKQGSAQVLSNRDNEELHHLAEIAIIRADEVYHRMLVAGVSKEEARIILPQNMMTNFWMTGNLRNWFQFLTLRLDSHAQYEVRIIAKKIFKELLIMFPIAGGALMKSMFNEQTLKNIEEEKI